MDLSDFLPKSETVDVVLRNPSTKEPLTFDDGKEFYITVYLPHTRESKESQQKSVDKWQKRFNKVKPTLFDLEENAVEHLARITSGWEIMYKGKKPKLSEATTVYTEVFWIKDQLQEALEEATDFMKV